MIVVLAIVCYAIFFVFGLPAANFWFSEHTVLRELQADHPEVARILKVDRNISARSVITVENHDGSRSDFLLDTNILQDYTFERRQDE